MTTRYETRGGKYTVETVALINNLVVIEERQNGSLYGQYGPYTEQQAEEKVRGIVETAAQDGIHYRKVA